MPEDEQRRRGARARARRPPRARPQAGEGARRAVPPGHAGRDPRGVRRRPGLDRRGRRRARARCARSWPTRCCARARYVAGANRTGWHLARRPARPRLPGAGRRHPHVEDGEPASARGGPLRIEPAIEVGNIFKLGTQLLREVRRHLPGRGRQGAAHLDGLLRHRPGAHAGRRPSSSSTTSTASSGRAAVAPFDVWITPIGDEAPAAADLADRPASRRSGLDVLVDDRAAVAGRALRGRRPRRRAAARHDRQEAGRGR